MKLNTIGARILAALLPLTCAAEFALPAAADIPPALDHAAALMMKSGSYHFDMTQTAGGSTITSTGDVASLNPMKVHVTTGGGAIGNVEVIGIAADMYMKTGSGPWTKYPGDTSSLTQMDIAAQFAKDRNADTTTDLGMQVKDGLPLHAYRIVNNARKTTAVFYLGADGRVARIEGGKMVMRFSKYGEAVTITPPM
jgi:hypothetical protein